MAPDAALSALGHASSGAVGTAVSTAVLYPLDLVTTRLKAQRQLKSRAQHDGVVGAFRDIIRDEGAAALYSGLGVDIGKSVLDSFLFFGFYNYLRQRGRQPPQALEELAIGTLAGMCARVVTTPISNAVARKQTSSRHESLSDVLTEIYKESGLLGLWSGYSATLVLSFNPSITFFANRRLAKRVIPALEEEDIPVAWAAFLTAAVSKASATAITYPFQTGKTRLQVASAQDDKVEEEKGAGASKEDSGSVRTQVIRFLDGTIFGVILRILHREGVRALYDGLSGELLKGFFSHGLTMFTKGLIHRLIVRLWLVQGPQLRQRLQKR